MPFGTYCLVTCRSHAIYCLSERNSDLTLEQELKMTAFQSKPLLPKCSPLFLVVSMKRMKKEPSFSLPLTVFSSSLSSLSHFLFQPHFTLLLYCQIFPFSLTLIFAPPPKYCHQSLASVISVNLLPRFNKRAKVLPFTSFLSLTLFNTESSPINASF